MNSMRKNSLYSNGKTGLASNKRNSKSRDRLSVGCIGSFADGTTSVAMKTMDMYKQTSSLLTSKCDAIFSYKDKRTSSRMSYKPNKKGVLSKPNLEMPMDETEPHKQNSLINNFKRLKQ